MVSECFSKSSIWSLAALWSFFLMTPTFVNDKTSHSHKKTLRIFHTLRFLCKHKWLLNLSFLISDTLSIIILHTSIFGEFMKFYTILISPYPFVNPKDIFIMWTSEKVMFLLLPKHSKDLVRNSSPYLSSSFLSSNLVHISNFSTVFISYLFILGKHKLFFLAVHVQWSVPSSRLW